jgi:hypothetical protein
MVVPKLGAVKNELGLAHNFMLFERSSYMAMGKCHAL